MFRFMPVVLLAAIIFMLPVVTAKCYAANTEKVLYSFNCASGHCGTSSTNDINLSGMIFDKKGNLYGASVSELSSGSNCDGYACGYIFELTPTKSGSWKEKTLYNFCAKTNCADGAVPLGGLVFDAAGNLYGTTGYGGSSVPGCGGLGCGTVFKLTPTTSGEWSETVLYNFTGKPDGSSPSTTLIFDKAGNLYGTAGLGGSYGYGIVFELVSSSSGKWTESILHHFGSDSTDGIYPIGLIAFDSSGNLYGSTGAGGKYTEPACASQGSGPNCGIVYQLAPSSGLWTENILYNFGGKDEDPVLPIFGVILDAKGNVYGATEVGGKYMGGTVFELAHGTWAESNLWNFQEPLTAQADGCNPLGGVILSSSGSLYGTTSTCGTATEQAGVVFELSPNGGSWEETVLWDFTSGSGGNLPFGPLVENSSGDLFGRATGGGTGNDGVAFEVIP